MPELKQDHKIQSQVRMMPLDTSSLFLPFGRPIAEYLQGEVGNKNGTKALLRQEPIEFPVAIRWTVSTGRTLRTTGFGQLERPGIEEPAVAPPEPEPAAADFLAFGEPGAVKSKSDAVKTEPAIEPRELPISRPRLSALPLRPRMTFGPPPPAVKAKTAPIVAPVPAPKPAAAAPVAKAGPAAVAPPKPGPAPVAKAPAAPTKPSPKPVTAIPPAPKPGAASASSQRVSLPVNSPVAAPAPSPVASPQKTAAPPALKTGAPASLTARAPEPVPAPPQKSAAAPAPASAKPEPAPLAVAPKVVPDAVPAARESTPAPSKPANEQVVGPKTSAAAPVETRPAKAPERQKPVEADASKPAAAVPAPARIIEPHLTMGADAESNSFISRISVPIKIALAVLLLSIALYFAFSKSGDKVGDRPVAMGEQGWSTEWAPDPVGSRRARQITLYRPSAHMEDYKMQFVGQIESKALGWVFRAADTKNYYGMKIEIEKPGSMVISHFAVVDGRQSSDSQRPLAVDARPGTAYRVALDVSGPRFTVSIGGEPVDFWTDNRLKVGAVGFMNERDERAITSSVQFSFPQGSK